MSTQQPDPWDELDDLAVSESRFIVDEIKSAAKAGKTEVVIYGFITPASVKKLQQKHYDVSQSISDEREVCTIIHLMGKRKLEKFTTPKENANTIRPEYASMDSGVHFC